MTNSYNSVGSLRGLLPPARKLPEAINTLPSPSSLPLLSIRTTLAPLSAARTAAVNPARPAPTTKTSHEISFMIFPSVGLNVLNDLNCLNGFRPRKLRNLVPQILGHFGCQSIVSHFRKRNLTVGEPALGLQGSDQVFDSGPIGNAGKVQSRLKRVVGFRCSFSVHFQNANNQF